MYANNAGGGYGLGAQPQQQPQQQWGGTAVDSQPGQFGTQQQGFAPNQAYAQPQQQQQSWTQQPQQQQQHIPQAWNAQGGDAGFQT